MGQVWVRHDELHNIYQGLRWDIVDVCRGGRGIIVGRSWYMFRRVCTYPHCDRGEDAAALVGVRIDESSQEFVKQWESTCPRGGISVFVEDIQLDLIDCGRACRDDVVAHSTSKARLLNARSVSWLWACPASAIRVR